MAQGSLTLTVESSIVALLWRVAIHIVVGIVGVGRPGSWDHVLGWEVLHLLRREGGREGGREGRREGWEGG